MIVEYNSSFLDKSISVPYDPYFDRHKNILADGIMALLLMLL